MRDELMTYIDNNSVTELMKNVLVKDEEESGNFSRWLKKYHYASTSSPEEAMEEMFKEDPDAALAIFEDYAMDAKVSDRLDLCCMTMDPDRGFVYAVMFDFGDGGVTYQLAKEKTFDEKGEFGYFPESLTEKLRRAGFDFSADGLASIQMKDEDAREIMSEYARFSEELQDFIIQEGNYLELPLEAGAMAEFMAGRKDGEERKEEEEDDDVSGFFGVKL